MVEVALCEAREVLVSRRDEEIQVSVIVIITPGTTERPAVGVDGIIDNDPIEDFCECTVPVASVEGIVAVCYASVGQEQIEVAIVVVVTPGTSVGIFNDAGERAIGDLCEGSVAIVSV